MKKAKSSLGKDMPMRILITMLMVSFTVILIAPIAAMAQQYEARTAINTITIINTSTSANTNRTAPSTSRENTLVIVPPGELITTDQSVLERTNQTQEQSRIISPSKLIIEKVFVHITDPNGGESIVLDQSDLTSIQFGYGGPLNTSSGDYSFRIELWKGGSLLGNTGTIKFPLNPYETSVKNYGHKPGTYFANNSDGYLVQKTAETGGGYKFRAVISEAFTPPGESTYYKELASDFSDNEFAYTAPETIPINLFKKFEPIFVAITYPNGGETITLNESIFDIKFSYGGSFSESKGGNYKYRIELWRNGINLGKISNLDTFPLVISKSSVSFGTKPGEYWVPKQGAGLEKKVAEPGSGYAYHVVLMEAVTPPGEPTHYDVLAKDSSDESFSLKKKSSGGQTGIVSLFKAVQEKITSPFQSIEGWFKNLFLDK